MSSRRAVAPGRVNLIGDHTDHTGGWVLPMAIDRATTVVVDDGDGSTLSVRSDLEAEPATLTLPVDDPGAVVPPWARYIAAVAAELGRTRGGEVSITSTVPPGAGLSSSAALVVATALAFGAEPHDVDGIVALAQRAERAASGVPCGPMDPLVSLTGRTGHALLIDTAASTMSPVPVPAALDVVVVDSGEPRRLAGSPYAERRARCEAAQRELGSLREAGEAALGRIADPQLRAAARHVISENSRVLAAADALSRGDAAAVGRLMVESHASLRDDLEVSTPALDALVDRLVATPGVHGARLTGAGFGGSVVAVCDRGVLTDGWVVRPSAGAEVQN